MLHRILSQKLSKALSQFPVIGLIGSRQVGKTTLAKWVAAQHAQEAVYVDLELPSDLAKLTVPELYLGQHADKLIILDEIQRMPNLFPTLRALVDQDRRPGRFLILGSASPDLIRQSSESLAGRIMFFELNPLHLQEVTAEGGKIEALLTQRWLRGGYPDSVLAATDEQSYVWREAFIRTFVERDIPQLGFQIPATQVRRFWEMVAHLHSQTWNASALARNFGLTAPTMRRYLDLLTDTFLLRQLQPLHANLCKRLVKAPKVYVRDTGLLHTLLRLPTLDHVQGHPVLGHSWEGFCIEQILQVLPASVDATFYRTHTGDELDLVLQGPGNQILAVEIKYTTQPKLGKGFWNAMRDLQIDEAYVITAGHATFPLHEQVTATSLPLFLQDHVPALFPI